MSPKYIGNFNARALDVELSEREAIRFWSNVEPQESGCWLWMGKRNDRNYGTISLQRDGRTKQLLAHRLSFVLCHRQLAARENVLHECDNPPCVRPDHLRVGTHADNTRDAVRRGRWAAMRSGRGHPATATHCAYGHARGALWAPCKTCLRERSRAQYHSVPPHLRKKRKPRPKKPRRQVLTGHRGQSGYIGVYEAKYMRKRRFIAKVHANGRSVYAGLHLTAEEAARARDALAIQLFGARAILNFPDENMAVAKPES